MAVIKLPLLRTSRDDATWFMENEVPEQGNTPLVTSRVEWSCAQWVIRTLQRMDEKGWFSVTPHELQNRDAYYAWVCQKGAKCEMGIANRVSWPDWVGVMVDGVRVLDGTS